jgi:hypothetical protein
MNMPLRALMATRPVSPDLSAHYLSDADWLEVDGLLASRGDPAAICERLVELLSRARARLPVMRPAPRNRPPTSPFLAAAGEST